MYPASTYTVPKPIWILALSPLVLLALEHRDTSIWLQCEFDQSKVGTASKKAHAVKSSDVAKVG